MRYQGQKRYYRTRIWQNPNMLFWAGNQGNYQNWVLCIMICSSVYYLKICNTVKFQNNESVPMSISFFNGWPTDQKGSISNSDTRFSKEGCNCQWQLTSHDLGFGWNFSTNNNLLKYSNLVIRNRTGNCEPFPMTNLPNYFVHSRQPGVRERFCNYQKDPYHQVWL